MRRFYLVRAEDVSGMSGTGVKAAGVVFDDGMTVVHWFTQFGGTEVYRSLRQCEECHGHAGRTKIIFIDETSSSKMNIFIDQKHFGMPLVINGKEIKQISQFSFDKPSQPATAD